jgi:ATP-dependent Lon protease
MLQGEPMAKESKREHASAGFLRNLLPDDNKDIPKVLAILPLRNSVFFPGGVLPLAVGRAKTIALIKDAVGNDQVIGVVTQRRAEEQDPGGDDLYSMGTVARMVKMVKMGEENYSLVIQGLARFRVLKFVEKSPYLKAHVEVVEEARDVDSIEVQALGISLKKVARELIELMPELPPAATELVESISHPGHLADLIAANVDVAIDEKQAVLETLDLATRMNLVLEVLFRKKAILKLADEISGRVKCEMSTTQREYFLRKQLQAIQEMLGEAETSERAADGCSFCGKLEKDVKKLIAGQGVAICEACVLRFHEGLAEMLP